MWDFNRRWYTDGVWDSEELVIGKCTCQRARRNVSVGTWSFDVQADRHQKAHSFVCASMYYKSKLEDLNEIDVFYWHSYTIWDIDSTAL